jgi:Acetyltransferase (GNAT) domain
MTFLDDPDFRKLPPDLGPLFAAAQERSFFSGARWYETFCRTALPEGHRPRIYLDRETAPRAALLCRLPAPGGARRLESLANFYSCEHALLLEPGGETEAAAGALAAALAAERPRWASIALTGFEAQDAAFARLAAALRATGFAVRPVFDSGTWFETTAGMSFAQYLAARPSQLRNTWRRKLAKAEKAHRLRWSFHADAADIDRAIADYETIYRASWKPTEGHPAFIPSLIRMAAETGALRLGLIHLDDVPAAAQLWILWRGKACIYKLAHDERFAALSLGTLLTMRMTERVLEMDRPWEINLGRGDDPYKKLWLPRRRERWGLVAANPRTAAGLKLALRHAAGRALRRFRDAGPAPPF